jgi:type IV pilus assembly protein PilO
MNLFEQLTKTSLPRKLAVLVGIIVLIAVGYWFVFYGALSEELENKKNQHATLLREKQSAIQAKASYDKDRRRLDELKENFSQQILALPSETNMSSFLDNLNAQAELVGLEIRSVKPQNEQSTENYMRIPVGLKLSGSFHQLAKFFYLVGNLDRIINIEDINLKTSEVEKSETVLEAEVLATAFRSLRVNEAATGKKKKKK